MVGGPVGAGMRVAPAPEPGCGTATPVAALGVGAFATGTDLFVGSDSHAASVDLARKKAADAGVGDRVSFEVACAQTFSGSDHDLVTMFDCLHDMGDPVSAARRVREALAPDGTWLLVEPFAGDAVEDNLNPVGRVFYAGSTMLCTPASLSQEVGLALGAQAGEQRLAEVLREGGFSHVRRSAETPFNLVLEVRP
jgi:SAM-dependent methyltransferase